MILSRRILREIATNALLGVVLFTFVLFLERMRTLFELLIRSSAPPMTVAYLFVLILPPVMTFTVPVGVLVGVLLTLSRMSGDAEITAMRAAGIPSRRVITPVMMFAVFGMLLAATASLWLTPFSIRQRFKLINRLAAAQLTADIQPRVFEEQFPNTILYVGDVVPGQTAVWRNMFLADISPPNERQAAGHEMGDGPKITVAGEAIAVPDVTRNRIQLSLVNGYTYAVGQDPKNLYSTAFPTGDQVLQADKPNEIHPRLQFTEMDTVPLMRAIRETSGRERIDAQLEFHQRLALPLACILLGLVGVPLGVSSRKGGKSSAFVLTVLIAFLYYMALISLISVAREGRMNPILAVWLPNAALLLSGLFAISRMEEPGDRDVAGAVRAYVLEWVGRIRGKLPNVDKMPRRRRAYKSLALLPQLIDTYVLSSFLYYWVMLLVSFVAMTHVFTFFELLGDIVKNRIPMWLVAKYLFFLTPQLIYDADTHQRPGGGAGHLRRVDQEQRGDGDEGLRREPLPAGRARAADQPGHQRRAVRLRLLLHPRGQPIQDAIRNEIKGRPPQTYLRPDRKWIYGTGLAHLLLQVLRPGERRRWSASASSNSTRRRSA